MRIALAALILAAPLAFAPGAIAQQAGEPYAHASIQRGDYDTAERKLLAELKIFPGKQEALLNLAAIYVKTGRHAEARALYDRVLTQETVAMDVTDGHIAPSHLVAQRGLARLDAARQAAR